MPLQSVPHLLCWPHLQLLSLCLLALRVGIFYTALCGLIINTYVLSCADQIACLVVLHLGLFVEHSLLPSEKIIGDKTFEDMHF